MIRDLNDLGAPKLRLTSDVAIIGGGLIGLIMACTLARRRFSVVVLESGGRSQDTSNHPLNRVLHKGQMYPGAEIGRFRCLGGTSTRWGGEMIPFLPTDFDSSSGTERICWPIGPEELSPYVRLVEEFFDLPRSSYEQSAHPLSHDRPCTASFVVRAPKWPSFGKRNVATIFGRDICAGDGPEVWLNSTATGFTLDHGGRVVELHASGSSGNRLAVAAKEVVVAAGTIESTRLLLKLDADYDHRVFSPSDVIGRYFHDHLSAPVADIEVTDRANFSRLTGFRFEGRGMRKPHFEVTGRTRLAKRLPPAFAQISLSLPDHSAFEALRSAYRCRQNRAFPAASDLARIGLNVGWLARAGWARVVHRDLLPPDQAGFTLDVVTEQEPTAANRITLHADTRDTLGMPLAELDWRVSERDITHHRAVAAEVFNYWSHTGMAKLAKLKPYSPDDCSQSLLAGGAFFHPGGCLRMGLSPNTSVVDSRLRTFASPNLHVVSTATFPNVGSAAPTMTLIQLALRVVDDLERALR